MTDSFCDQMLRRIVAGAPTLTVRKLPLPPIHHAAAQYSSTSSSSATPPPSPSLPNFNDSKTAFSGISSFALARAWVVLKLCTFRALVDNAETLLQTSRKVLGDNFVEQLVRPTFFNHFCAGTTEVDIKPVIQYLEGNGIGAILDYAAEADVETEASRPDGEKVHQKKDRKSNETTVPSPRRKRAWQSNTGQRKKITARIYDYSTEKQCDLNADIFESAIRAVHNVSPEGFAAIKLTALGNPLLLERWSNSIVHIKKLFQISKCS